MTAGVIASTARVYDLGALGGSPPARPRSAVHRPGLLAALDEAPLIVAVAPAGFGKTSLLSEWCAGRHGRCAWLTLTPGHDRAPTLLRAITRAVDEALERA